MDEVSAPVLATIVGLVLAAPLLLVGMVPLAARVAIIVASGLAVGLSVKLLSEPDR